MLSERLWERTSLVFHGRNLAFGETEKFLEDFEERIDMDCISLKKKKKDRLATMPRADFRETKGDEVDCKKLLPQPG